MTLFVARQHMCRARSKLSSVRLSVTQVEQPKMVEIMIAKFYLTVVSSL